MIREQQEDDQKSETNMSVTDEELSLLGAPWAKEGLVFRKHYWDSAGKRAKEKNWLQVFVVISQGEVRMFRFDTGGSSKAGQGGGGVGGGDWTVRLPCAQGHATLLMLLSPVLGPERRLALAHARALLVDATTGLQSRPAALLRSHAARRRDVLLPGRHAGPRR